MTDIERVRALCKSKGVPVAALEKALGFSNGYLNPKKAKTISYARLMQIAAYFNVPISDIFSGADISGNADPTKKPASVSADGVKINPHYFDLSEEDRAVVDAMIERLSKAGQ